MRILAIIILLPILALGQRSNEDWTTPIADVKFSEGKIIYSYSADDQPGFFRIQPVSFDKNLLVMKQVRGIGWLDGDDMHMLFKQTDEYLENWQPGIAHNRDKYILLEHCVIKILWEPQEKLSAHTLEMIDLLKSDLSIDIAISTGLVMKLYDYYNNSH
jgi:hypothetical protein